MNAHDKINFIKKNTMLDHCNTQKFTIYELKELLKKYDDTLNKNLDTQEFYDLMQFYRMAQMTDQPEVVKRFEAIKEWISQNYTMPTASVDNFTKDEFELMKHSTWVVIKQTEINTPRFSRLNKLKQKLEKLHKKHYSR